MPTSAATSRSLTYVALDESGGYTRKAAHTRKLTQLPATRRFFPFSASVDDSVPLCLYMPIVRPRTGSKQSSTPSW
eukprot:6183662-Pleurochrysis_carterae.AAC.1